MCLLRDYTNEALLCTFHPHNSRVLQPKKEQIDYFYIRKKTKWINKESKEKKNIKNNLQEICQFIVLLELGTSVLVFQRQIDKENKFPTE